MGSSHYRKSPDFFAREIFRLRIPVTGHAASLLWGDFSEMGALPPTQLRERHSDRRTSRERATIHRVSIAMLVVVIILRCDRSHHDAGFPRLRFTKRRRRFQFGAFELRCLSPARYDTFLLFIFLLFFFYLFFFFSPLIPL